MHLDCQCGERIDAPDLDRLGDAFLAHVRGAHAAWPYSDQAVRNFAEATQRLTGPSERLEALGPVVIHPVTPDRLDDWAAFFDHDAFVGAPEWAACYCIEPHIHDPAAAEPEDVDDRSGAENRRLMRERLGCGDATGYLAYVDGRPAGWVNASRRSHYALYRNASDDVADADVVGISCFVIAPPYRRHGLAARLLDRVIEDAPTRGVDWIEAYPFLAPADAAKDFRGPRSLYEARGFETVRTRERDVVMRRPVERPGSR